MKLKQLLRSMRQSFKSSRRPAHRPTKRRRPLRLEALEDRVVPSLLFKPIFGSEDPTTIPGDALQSPHAYFTFWGSYWNTTAGTQYENALINISQEYLSSSILQGDKQYGGDGLAYYGTSWIDSSDPPANFNSLSHQGQFNDVQATIQGAIDNQSSPIPAPSHVATTPVYLVVLPPTPDLQGGAGWNNIGAYTSGGTSTPIHMVLLRTFPNSTPIYSILLSHEFQESVNSDVVITHPQSLPLNLNGDYQICDNETNGVYYYQLPTGAWAQAYWSHQDGQYIIPEGNSQSLQLSAIWNVNSQTGQATCTGQYDLTINGSQGLAANDTVTIAASGTTVSVTLNGENWQFPINDPLHSITISNLQGNATVNIEGTAGTPVTVNLGTGTDTVNITPTSQNLDNLLANVQVNGGAGYDTLNVFDSTNTFNDTYTMTAASITRNNAPTVSYGVINAVNVYGGNGTEIYTVNNTAAFFTTTIHGGATANTVNVLGTTGTLNVVGGSSSDVVNVGNSGSVQAIFGDIHVTNPFFYSALNVDDSADTTGHGVTITNASITGLAPAGIYYAQTDLRSLNIKAGSGGSTFSVQSTPNNPAFNPVPTSLSSLGTDTVIVGNAGSVQGIQGSLTIDNTRAFDTILVDDSADGTPRTATLSTFTPAGDTNFGEISGLAPAAINYEYNGTTSFTVKTGNVAGNVVNVLATGTLTNLVGNASTIVNVGNAGSVQSILGTLNIENPPSFTAITIDDSSDVTARNVVLSSVGPNASDSQTNGDGWDQISGLAPANINYEEYDTLNVTINTGKTAGNVVGFLATDSDAVTTLNANAATTINVGAGNAQSIAGTLTLNGPANSLTVKVDDSADAFGRVTTLAAGSLTGLTPGAINFTASMMKSLTVNAGGGNDAFTVSAAPTFTTTVDLRGGNNTLTGPNTSNTWMITGANHGTLDSKLTFSNAENLVGGTGNDTFKFSGATPSIAGTVTGGGGTDKLDYSLYTGGPISVNLATNAISLVNGGAAGGFIGTLASVAGNSNAGNKLTAANSLNNWAITAKNGGKVNTLSFANMPNLVGGSGLDIFKFANSLLDTVASIDGGGGGDWLDYSGFAAAVAVNLVANTATNVTGSIHNIQNVHGGNSTTTLTGDSQGNILIGGSASGGAITGGSGRSLLIADKGGAAVTGGSSAGDILIADSTTFDSDSNAHLQALMSVLAEWQSADSLATRFHDINTGTGGGLNGTNMLKWGTTVKDDPLPDAALTVTAASASGLDWFFVDTNDTAVNFVSGDHKDNT